MTTAALDLSPEEREALIPLLETALSETRVELHHTHFSPDFREFLKDRSSLLQSILTKLREASA